MFNFITKKNKAFTLVETLVALSIFSVSLVAVIAVLGSSLSNTTYAKQKETAAYLAQEGVEYMRNMRDTYMLYDAGGAQTGWDAFSVKMGGCNRQNGCYFNADGFAGTMDQLPLSTCDSTNCSSHPLLYDSSTGKYGYTGAVSGFSRQITAQTISLNETRISSYVYWTQGSRSYNISFSEDLFNWIE